MVLVPSRSILAAISLAVILTTPGCSVAAEEVVPPRATAAVPSESSAASPDPSPSASIDLAEPEAWIIDSDGIGPVHLGETMATVREDLTAYTDSSSDACRIGTFTRAGGPDIWVVPLPETDIVGMVLVTGNADPIAVAGGSPRTAEGLGVGGTVDELLTAYPAVQTSRVPSETGSGTDYYVGGPEGYINFGEDGGIVRSIVVSSDPAIPYEYCG